MNGAHVTFLREYNRLHSLGICGGFVGELVRFEVWVVLFNNLRLLLAGEAHYFLS
jgi:hypothetical protein